MNIEVKSHIKDDERLIEVIKKTGDLIKKYKREKITVKC